MLTSLIVLDRTGKGIRTAPRDTMISLSSPPKKLATAFGLLALAPGAFDAIFVVSFCVALIGLGVLTLFVENQPPDESAAPAPAVSLGEVTRLLQLAPFRTLILIGTTLSLATISDGFLYLSMQRRMSFSVGLFPLLYVMTALIFMALAIPAGRLADRMGRGQVFIGGYGLLLCVYMLLLLPSVGWLDVCLTLPLFGAYYAATDGVLMAQASAILPAWLRGSGLALLTTATGLARLLASMLFGLLWTWVGVNVAIVIFMIALAPVMGLALVALRRTDENADAC